MGPPKIKRIIQPIEDGLVVEAAELAEEHQYPHLLRIPPRALQRSRSEVLIASQKYQTSEVLERIPLGSPPSYRLSPFRGLKKWHPLTSESSLRSSLSESSLWHLQMFQEDMSPRSSLILTTMSAILQTPLQGSYPSMVPRLRKRGRAAQSMPETPMTSCTQVYQETVMLDSIPRDNLS